MSATKTFWNHIVVSRSMYPWIGTFLGMLFLACGSREKSPLGFHLPDGDPGRGREVFLELKCNSCHQVAGLDLPPPTVNPPVPVVLGGENPYVMTDGKLVTSIIDPSHEIPKQYLKQLVVSEGRSRMTNYEQEMTVQQLEDLVAFLHPRYKVGPSMLWP